MNSSVERTHVRPHRQAYTKVLKVKPKFDKIFNKFYEIAKFSDSNNRKRSHPVRSASVVSTQEEKDLISFASEIPQTSQNKAIEDDPYNILKESILKLGTNQPQQQNQQIIPYNKPQQPSLSPEGLNSLYSMNPSINQYYSQHMYFHASPQPTTTPYPAIGFSHYTQQQQPNFPIYGLATAYYQTNQSQTYSWPTQLPSTASSSSTISKPNITPTQLIEPKVAALSVKQPPSLYDKAVSQVTKATTSNSDNLIDFDVDDSKYAANILQSFDPLISSNRNSTEDAENTYYTDQDPFDYIYSGGTQYSDPLYEAVVRSDHSLASPKSQTPQEISEYYVASGTCDDSAKPPPLPPRNLKNSQSFESQDDIDQQNGSVARFSKKLYENVTHRKQFDRDLIAFYTMVKELRSKYTFDDETSNIGHILAAELDNKYLNVSSIKLMIYPSFECFEGKYNEPHSDRNQENFQKLEGYANPIVFTCDINSNITLVILNVLVVLEGEISGNAEDYALKTIGSQEWLSHSSSLSHLEYIQSNIKLEKDIQLGMFPKLNKHMKILARTQQDDLRDADIKLENILPKEAVSSISYDTLMILLETVEMEIDKLECAATDNQQLHPSGVIQAVKAICALLGSIDTLELFMAINNLKEACQTHSPSYQIRVSLQTLQLNNFFMTSNKLLL
jgi:phosphatidylinositol-4-phosphate 3-kinase